MLKRDWLVVGVYFDNEGIFQARCVVYDNTRKKDAINAMYDYLCWNEDGLKLNKKI